MIEAGDKVRYSNKYLTSIGRKRSVRKSKWFARRRGEQKIMTVLAIRKGRYDWKSKRYTGDLILLDNKSGFLPFTWINVHWLRFVRKDT